MFKKVLVSAYLLSLLALFGSINIAHAGLLNTVKQGGLDNIGSTAYNQTGDPSDIRVIVGRLINVFLGFLGIIFVVLVVFAGYEWMTSGGDSGKIGTAKKRLAAGIIGLLIVLASYGISAYVTACVWNLSTDSSNPWVVCPGH
ncbi:hypothetical protein HGA64_03855 [Candidatus Falkowbacteria bacterium]|nr:hypothetical protein [Candidatus Falkowbacteria bacterium]